MYLHRHLALCFAFFLINTSCAAAPHTPTASTKRTYATLPSQTIFKNGNRHVRVLLAQYDATTTHHLRIGSATRNKDTTDTKPNNLLLESPAHSGVLRASPDAQIDIVCKDGNLFLPSGKGMFRKLKQPDVVVQSKHDRLTFGTYTYQGCIRIVIDRPTKKLFVINTLDLEDYVCSVLRSESIATWPMEMQMVQAITSRTYVAYWVAYGNQHNPYHHYYDIKNNTSHQIYQGVHSIKRLHEAVCLTRGMVITHGQALALTMFDACCGGIIPAHIRRYEVRRPYLARSVPCYHCKDSYLFTWNKQLSAAAFVQALHTHPRLQDKIASLGVLRSVKISDQDRAGIAHKITLRGSKNTTQISGSDVRSSIGKDIRSDCLKVHLEKDMVRITGRGFGHQLGLCQCGARAMVRLGHTCDQILAFYFPGTALCTLG